MPALLSLNQSRRDREATNAHLVEEGTSWGLPGAEGVLISALGFVVAYALPFFRLIALFLRHADQF